MSKKKAILSAKIDYLIDYAKREYSKPRGLHLNSADWKGFITVGTPQYYSFLINGTMKFYTKSKISGERYDQILKLVDYKKLEAPLLLLFLTKQPDDIIIDFISLLFSHGEAKLFCNDPSFCLEENTLIDLADGRTITVKELCNEYIDGKTNYVYSVDSNSNPTVNKVNKVWKSGEAKRLIKVTLDNGKNIITTPEHYYIMRDGSDVMAKDLNVGDSLMPIYITEDNKHYKCFKMNGEKYKYKKKTIHRLVAEKYLDNKDYDKNIVIHHIDFNKFNNNPHNLIYMDKVEHIKYHAQHINDNRKNIQLGIDNSEYRYSDKYKEQRSQVAKRAKRTAYAHGYSDNAFILGGKKWLQEHKNEISEKMKATWKDEDKRSSIISKMKENWNDDEYRNTMINGLKNAWTEDRKKVQSDRISKINSKRNAKMNSNPSHIISSKLSKIFKVLDSMIKLNLDLTDENYETVRKTTKSINWNKIFDKFEVCLDTYNYYVNDIDRKKEIVNGLLTYNHKIINIEYLDLDTSVDVYDIEVENDHNFYVNAGVVLHNSYWGMHYNLTQIHSAYGPGEMRPPNKRDPNRQNLVCKHLWLVLDQYSKSVKVFAKGLLPYYKRMFGLTSPTGIDRLQKSIGQEGFRKIIEQAIVDLNKLKSAELTNRFKQLTNGKLNEIMKPMEQVDNEREYETIDKSKPEELKKEVPTLTPKVKETPKPETEIETNEKENTAEITPNDMDKMLPEEKKEKPEELL